MGKHAPCAYSWYRFDQADVRSKDRALDFAASVRNNAFTLRGKGSTLPYPTTGWPRAERTVVGVAFVELQHAVVDLSFRLRGSSIPADHGYALFGALSRQLPWLHGDEAVGIHPIHGQLIGQRQLALTRLSRLTLRLPAAKIPDAIRLAGCRLEVDGASLLVGVPEVRPLQPRPSLVSRLVVIRGFTEPASFLEAVERQMARLEIDASPSLLPRRRDRSLEAQAGAHDAIVRRTLRICDKEVVGFAVQVGDLNMSDSLRLQAAGLGGRRRFGCGVFLPAREQAR